MRQSKGPQRTCAVGNLTQDQDEDYWKEVIKYFIVCLGKKFVGNSPSIRIDVGKIWLLHVCQHALTSAWQTTAKAVQPETVTSKKVQEMLDLLEGSIVNLQHEVNLLQWDSFDVRWLKGEPSFCKEMCHHGQRIESIAQGSGMIATAPLTSGDRWLFESVFGRTIFRGHDEQD